ncbi:MAG: type IV pilus twitching motility protein PilT [Acetivibrionales bacterium]|jgi:twitching motility protein PilT
MYTLTDVINLIKHARDNNATDIHMSAGAVPAMRIEGQLAYMPFDPLTQKDTNDITAALLNKEQLEVLQKNHYISSPVVIKEIGRLRANISTQRSSYSVNLKLLDSLCKTCADLRLPDAVIDLHKKESGLILVCGNKNSGKSTTIAFLIKEISRSRVCNIITIEDPIEYLFKHDKAIVNQKEVGIDVNSFIEGVSSAVKQDPDVIMISSVRDPETFSEALAAAEEGCLVITALQTSSSVSTIQHIIDMYPNDKKNYMRVRISKVLQAIVSQQLLPGADGKGRVMALEVMLANRAVKNLIRENKIHQIPDVIKASKALGMITMEESINDLYLKGLIPEQSALNVYTGI